MTLATVFLLDSKHRGVGGINSLNRDLIGSRLADEYDFRRSDWDEIWYFGRQVSTDRRPVIFVFDDVVTWAKIHKLFRLRRVATKWAKRHRRQVRFVLREHHYSEGFVRHCVRCRTRFKWMLKVAYSLMDSVIAVSACQVRWMEKERLCCKAKVLHLPHAGDVSLLLRLDFPNSSVHARDAALMDGDRGAGRRIFVFGAMGRLEFQKGFDTLIQAWGCFKERDNVMLLIAGDGRDREYLHKLAVSFKMIHFLGEVSDPSVFFARCDCIVLPSRYEPFGQVCLEGRASGRPVIVSSADGLPEQVADQYGWVFPEGDVDALSERLVAVKTLKEINPGEFDAMAIRARRSAENCWEQYVDEFREYLGQILRG